MKKLGKCTRCGRKLKTVFLIDGAEYGPVCVKKMGGTTAATPREGGRKPRQPRIQKPSDQLTFLEIEDMNAVPFTD